MGDFGSSAPAAFEARSSASLGLPANSRGDPLSASGQSAVADATTRAISADDHGSALFLPLERDGCVAIDQPRPAADAAAGA